MPRTQEITSSAAVSQLTMTPSAFDTVDTTLIYYSDTVQYQANKYYLVSPQSIRIGVYSKDVSALKGKFFFPQGATSGATLYMGSNSIAVTLFSGFTSDYVEYWYLYATGAQQVTVKITEATDELQGFVIENDSAAYPNGAIHTDGYYYELYGSV